MKKIRKVYDYMFYTFYRFWEKAPSKWWSDWKAVITICFLIVILLSSMYNLLMYATLRNLLPQTKLEPTIVGLLIFGFNYYYYLYKDKWKNRIVNFNSISGVKDRIGILFVILFTLTVITFYIYTIYLISTVDWQNLR